MPIEIAEDVTTVSDETFQKIDYEVMGSAYEIQNQMGR